MTFWEIVWVIVNFAGALGVFLFGMKLMSEGLQKFAGSKMRHILARITGKPLSGILTGTAVTAAIQSSSATTVMVVSFVNAGILSLAGAIAVIMGANIGTTLTAWIIYLFGLGEGSGFFSLPMTCGAMALVFMFIMKGDKMKSIGEFVMGLALLLVGMEYLKQAMPDLQQYPAFLEFLGRLSDFGFWSILIFIGIGAILTCLVQASAAMMAITLVMCYNGWIGFDVAVALVMGQNIGTTITANLAAMVSNAMGKRAARAHLVFNVVGVLITLAVFYPVMGLIAKATTAICANPYLCGTDAGYNPDAIPLAICFFHTFFNVGNTFILAWFIPQIVKIVNWMVKPEKEESEDEFRLTYIGSGFTNTAELDLQAAKNEIENFSKRVIRMYQFLPGLRTAKDDEEFNSIMDRIEKYESITDRMEIEIAQFLTKVGQGELSEKGAHRVSSMMRIVDNLESVGDAIYQIAMQRKSKREQAVHFDQGMNDNIAHMRDLVQHALDVMDSNLHCSYDKIDIDAACDAEDAINQYRDVLRNRHLDALRLGVYDYSIGSAYSTIFALYEKLGDYIINVSEAIDNSRKIAGDPAAEDID
ncbi:MAG: Na/Pi cotransporter family protein [Bacteroidales bacterium]|nr:Na/Pi cotransporter family protein [Bacteroidales bacterium]